MGVTLASQGGGKLSWPGTPNLKPALVSGEGWWTGAWVQLPTASHGASTMLVCGDFNSNGIMTEAGECQMAFTRTSAGTGERRMSNTARRAGNSTECWAGSGTTTTLDDTANGGNASDLTLGQVYLFLWGLQEVSGTWRLWRAVVAKNGAVRAKQVSPNVAAIDSLATTASRIYDRIFQDAGTNIRTLAGTGLEHHVIVKGLFPFAAGVPDNDVLEGLADGTYTWESAEVLNGGNILDWRVLETADDRGNDGSNGVGALDVTGTVNTTVAHLAPDSWFSSPLTLEEPPAGFVWADGQDMVHHGTYPGVAPAGIKARVRSGGVAVSGFDWHEVVASPAGNVFNFDLAAPPAGGPYRLDLRFGDDEDTEVLGAQDFYVGDVVFAWGQSQMARMFSQGAGTVNPAVGLKATVVRASDRTNVTSSVANFAQVSASAHAGSGAMAILNQWHADTGGRPIMLVELAYQGTSIEFWISDRRGDYLNEGSPGVDVTTLWGDGEDPESGYATFMAHHVRRQASAILLMQGTSDVAFPDTYAAYLDDLKDLFGGIIDTPHLLCGVPHQRSNDGSVDGNQCWRMRNAQFGKFSSGGDWRVLCHLPDIQMDADGSPHQVNGATGNIRMGTRMGRGAAGILVDAGLDRLGAQILSVAFTSAGKTAIDITFDRNIEAPSGHTDNLPGWFLTTNAWATTGGHPGTYSSGFTAARVAANKIRLTKTAGDWTAAGSVRIDYLRSTPFDTDGGANGGEAAITTLLDDILYDTGSFDGGRGLPVRSVFGDGFLVAAYTDAVIVSAGQMAVLTEAELATAVWLTNDDEVADGLGPVTMRWKDGPGESGVTAGVDVELNVVAA